MAQQVKFYAVSQATDVAEGGGIYFVTGGELYKGTSRFGANKVFTVPANTTITGETAEAKLSAALTAAGVSANNANAIGGDILTGYGAAKVFNGSTWVELGQDQAAIDQQLSELVSGLAFDGEGSYITGITQGADGKVSASVSNFATDVKTAIGNGSASGYGNGITVSVVTTSGSVTGVEVSASQISCDTVTAGTGNFTNLNVSDTATFSATTVSADTLTIGGKTVAQIAGEQIAASTLSGNIAAPGGTSLVTDGQVVNYVSAAIQSFDNAMHYIGATSDAAIVQDATAVPSDITGYSTDVRKAGDIILKGTEEYIWNGSKWEKIGDQSAVTGGDSTSTLNNVSVQVVTAAATAAPTVTLTGIGTAASMDYTSEIDAAGSALPTESAVAAYVSEFAAEAAAKASTGASYATYGGLSAAIELFSNAEPTITLDGANVVTASTGVVTESANLVTAGAVADYVTASIGALDASASDTDKGVFVEVVEADGKISTVDVSVTAVSTMALNATGSADELATTAAIKSFYDNNLVWLDANGNAIA